MKSAFAVAVACPLVILAAMLCQERLAPTTEIIAIRPMIKGHVKPLPNEKIAKRAIGTHIKTESQSQNDSERSTHSVVIGFHSQFPVHGDGAREMPGLRSAATGSYPETIEPGFPQLPTARVVYDEPAFEADHADIAMLSTPGARFAGMYRAAPLPPLTLGSSQESDLRLTPTPDAFVIVRRDGSQRIESPTGEPLQHDETGKSLSEG